MPELKLPFLGHGGDYNPDQWRDRPDILQEDIRLMRLAGCNLMSVGIFAWAALEPEEGVYDLDWLEKVLDDLHGAGISVFLATPSGARPAWMSQRYPEVLRVNADGRRIFHGARHNHCYTSPVYRGFVERMDRALAERFGRHPAVVGWHISNEFGGECHCELCQAAFRDWLKARYGTLDALNRVWWAGAWSETYTDWSQLRGPSPIGEDALHGLDLAWKRFVTHQTTDFMNAEKAAIRAAGSDAPVTTNFMGLYDGLDYFAMARDVDFVSFDSYPAWGVGDPEEPMLFASFNYDWMRSLGRKPFILMESTPSQVNWQPVCKLKKPGAHLLASLQAVAHGSDSVLYFQWRKGRGGSEKFHGAVVDHAGHEHTRTFREVAQVGDLLKKLNGLQGSMPRARAALVFDTWNRWALDDCQGPRRDLKYMDTAMEHYRALKRQGVDVDVIDETCDLSAYRLVAAPMLYLLRPGFAEKLAAFVRGGGIVVCTALTGRVDEDDLCFLGGFPGPLREVLGIWAEETDALTDDERNGIAMADGHVYSCSTLCDRIHAETAKVLGSYTDDFYAGEPCVTENAFGAGAAVYVATRPDAAFLDDLYAGLVDRAGIERPAGRLPLGVQATTRGDTLFVMNFSGGEARVILPAGTDALTGAALGGEAALAPNGYVVERLRPAES